MSAPRPRILGDIRSPIEYRAGRPEDWRDEANCLGIDVREFFAEKGHNVPPPVWRICSRCPVAQACWDWALANHVDQGVWGGSTPSQRRRAKIGDPAPALTRCECGQPVGTPRMTRCTTCRAAVVAANERDRQRRRRAEKRGAA